MQYSAKYKEGLKSGTEEISKDEYTEFLESIKSLARNAESESVRARLLLRLVDEKKGRLDKKTPKSIKGTINQVNIIQFSEEMKRVKESMMKHAIIDVAQVLPKPIADK
jgi:hypothetical protein